MLTKLKAMLRKSTKELTDSKAQVSGWSLSLISQSYNDLSSSSVKHKMQWRSFREK